MSPRRDLPAETWVEIIKISGTGTIKTLPFRYSGGAVPGTTANVYIPNYDRLTTLCLTSRSLRALASHELWRNIVILKGMLFFHPFLMALRDLPPRRGEVRTISIAMDPIEHPTPFAARRIFYGALKESIFLCTARHIDYGALEEAIHLCSKLAKIQIFFTETFCPESTLSTSMRATFTRAASLRDLRLHNVFLTGCAHAGLGALWSDCVQLDTIWLYDLASCSSPACIFAPPQSLRHLYIGGIISSEFAKTMAKWSPRPPIETFSVAFCPSDFSITRLKPFSATLTTLYLNYGEGGSGDGLRGLHALTRLHTVWLLQGCRLTWKDIASMPRNVTHFGYRPTRGVDQSDILQALGSTCAIGRLTLFGSDQQTVAQVASTLTSDVQLACFESWVGWLIWCLVSFS